MLKQYLLPPALALAMLAVPTLQARADEEKFEKDRAAILAMAGDFKVHFEFDQTMTFDASFPVSDHYESEAMETVQVLEDRGDFISLQHILVVQREDKDPHVVKHWRQDWQFEDDLIYSYQGKDAWQPVELSRKDRRGTWSQSVFQVDDSPRYEGYGTWVHDSTQSYWQSHDTWRPLPRREEDRSDEYDALGGTNRHVLTPEGWVHQQDNEKIAVRDGAPRVLARETGINHYTRVSDYDFSAAQDYWEKTAGFWKQVREAWDETFAKEQDFRIDDGGGAPLWRDIFSLAKRYEKGDFATSEEIAEAIAKRLNEKVFVAAAR